MEISQKLANEFHTILSSHFISLFLLATFSYYIYIRSQKNPLLYSYLSVIAMTSLWVIAKILKTLSPVLQLRWFFILIQFFAIDLLGICLLMFAYIYRKGIVPTKKMIAFWSVLPLLSFLIVLTNPFHMLFYSYFDIYKDRFGPLFYLAQSVQYIYLFIGIIWLGKNYKNNPMFQKMQTLGKLFRIFICLPLLANVYYILFKMNVVEWHFPFPVFDFTPIAISLSFLLFIIPIFRYRFFDFSPLSMRQLYDLITHGICYIDQNLYFFGANKSLYQHLGIEKLPNNNQFFLPQSILSFESNEILRNFLSSNYESKIILLTTLEQKILQIQKINVDHNILKLVITDITEINQKQLKLQQQNIQLLKLNERLQHLMEKEMELSAAKASAITAQTVHDILGHSLTVLIGSSELLISDIQNNKSFDILKKIAFIEELITSTINDLKNNLIGYPLSDTNQDLINVLKTLENEILSIKIETTGDPYHITPKQTEVIFRVCQEAITNSMKHGIASYVYIIIRYQTNSLELFIIDNGKGCKQIEEHMGIQGMKKRVHDIRGTLEVYSDGENGFTIQILLPI